MNLQEVLVWLTGAWGARAQKDHHDGRCKVRFLPASHVLLMSRKLLRSFIQPSRGIVCQELGTGMPFCHPVNWAGWKCPECVCRVGHCISEPSFPVWLSACQTAGMEPGTKGTEVRVACCCPGFAHTISTSHGPDPRLRLGLVPLNGE